MKHGISVVICAYTEDRWDDLVAAIDSIEKQSLSPLEIILVIDHNPALFTRAKNEFREILLIINRGDRGLSDARNSGVAASSGDVIVFMDEDAVAEPDWLSRLDEHYRDPFVMGVGGLVVPNWVAGKPGWFPVEFNWVVGCSYKGLPEKQSVVRNMIGCNMSLRREIFDTAGGFRSGIGRVGAIPLGCEETELCIRVNQHFPNTVFMFEPSANVRHRVPEQRGRFRYFLLRCFAEGISKALITKFIGADGLSSEKDYTFKTLPRGVWQGVLDTMLDHNFAGLARAWSIGIGFSTTTLGYIIGKVLFIINPQKNNIGKEKAVSIDAYYATE